MSREKRKFSRVPFHVKGVLEVDGKRLAAEKLINLSIGGCLTPVETEFEPGTPCRIYIQLNDRDESLNVVVDGEISWTEFGKTAVKFTMIEPESLHHLQNIILYNAGDPDAVEEEISKHRGIF